MIQGTLQLISGSATASRLLATNTPTGGFDGQAGSSITFSGGTLSASNSTVNNGSAHVVGDGSSVATLQLLGNGLHTFINGLVLPNNGRLTGNGTVSGNLTAQSGGIVYPGGSASLGRLVLSNSPALNGTVYVDISNRGATLTNDQIQSSLRSPTAAILSSTNWGRRRWPAETASSFSSPAITPVLSTWYRSPSSRRG